jgi:hypothetical protein
MKNKVCFWIWYIWKIENSDLHWAMGSAFLNMDLSQVYKVVSTRKDSKTIGYN